MSKSDRRKPQVSTGSSLSPQQVTVAGMFAGGRTVKSVAEELGIAERTLYDWRALPGFKAEVEMIRGRIRDEIIGRLTTLAAKAVRELGKLATGASAEAVRLGACRAILGELVSVSVFSELKKEIAEVKAMLTPKDASQ